MGGFVFFSIIQYPHSYSGTKADWGNVMIQLGNAFGARCEILASYLIEHGGTVRSTAAHYGISKSTVHKDLTEKLKYRNPALYGEVAKILCINKAERHLRGGEATRQKYQKEK